MKRLFISAMATIVCVPLAAQTSYEKIPSPRLGCELDLGIAHSHCYAYCEAMDCDSSSPIARKRACRKVKAQWLQITGQENLPCERIHRPVCSLDDLWFSFVIDDGARDYECMCDLDGQVIPWMARSSDQDSFCRRCWDAGQGRCLAGWAEEGRSVCKCA